MKPISEEMNELLHLMEQFQTLTDVILNKVDEIIKENCVEKKTETQKENQA